MSRSPYHRIHEVEDDDLERETQRRKERREVIQAKKVFIGSGEDAGIYQQLNYFNDFPVDQESHA